MSIPKGRRKQSRFEAPHQLRRMRTEITDLALNNFGFSKRKYQKLVEKYRESHSSSSNNIDEVVANFEEKLQSFYDVFIPDERSYVIGLIRQITRDFSLANSIYPTEGPAGRDEYIQRRLLMDQAIGECYSLKQEIQYIIETIPVDANKYERFADMIDRQIGLFKGVRNADNRFTKLFQDADDKGSSSADSQITQTPRDCSNSQSHDSKDVEDPTCRPIKTYQDLRRERQPNTSKMNKSRFQPAPTSIGEIKPVLPGQSPPAETYN